MEHVLRHGSNGSAPLSKCYLLPVCCLIWPGMAVFVVCTLLELSVCSSFLSGLLGGDVMRCSHLHQLSQVSVLSKPISKLSVSHAFCLTSQSMLAGVVLVVHCKQGSPWAGRTGGRCPLLCCPASSLALSLSLSSCSCSAAPLLPGAPRGNAQEQASPCL